MIQVICLRGLAALPILFGVSVFVFLLLHLAPGDAAQAIAGPFATREVVEAYRSEYGLNDPLPVQYVRWLMRVLHGDLGKSPALGVPIAPVVLSRFANTLVLATSSLLLAVVGGLVIGIVVGMRPRSRLSTAVMGAAIFLANIPEYLFGLLLVLVFAVNLRVLPASGMYNIRDPGGLSDLISHLVLPAVAVSLAPMAVIARMTRASVIEIGQKEYVMVARAMGLRERTITLSYVVPNALPPILSVAGLQVGSVLGGSAFAEVVFSWPGIGSQLYNAIVARDIPTIQAATLLVALTFMLVNLATDIAVSIADPRLRRP